ncbi:hypothetical protein FJZ33_12890 [Candidatus Poribacteria bacterium]|nr:hypothetical protein [Candidatus Poribacteria bacterium]
MDIKELQERFSRLSVLVCGDMCLDKNYIGGYSGYSRELEHLPIFRTDIETYSPGGGGNLCSCFAALGVNTIAAGVWGPEEDFNRYILEAEFRKRNIDISGMVVGSRTPTFGKVYLHNASHVYRIDLTSERISDEALDELILRLDDLAKSVDFIACADYEEANDYGVCSKKVLDTVVKSQLPKFGTSRKRITDFKGFNRILLNSKELMEQSEIDKSAEMPLIVEDFIRFLQANEIVITMSGKGATAYSLKGFPATGVNSLFVGSIELTGKIDPCGCGDMFYAAYSSSIMAGYNTENSLRIANAAGRVVARKLFGTGQATLEEIIQEYEVLYPDKK